MEDKDWKKGWFHFAPVYYNTKTKELTGRGTVSTWVLYGVLMPLHNFFMFCTSYICDIELCYPIKLTGHRYCQGD